MENSAAHMRLAVAVAKGRLSGVDAMTAPTRRQLMAGSLAALGAAGGPAIAVAASPDERLRLAVQKLHDAMQERWPGADIRMKGPFEHPGRTIRSAWFIAHLPVQQ